jgi:hypothetical protein
MPLRLSLTSSLAPCLVLATSTLAACDPDLDLSPYTIDTRPLRGEGGAAAVAYLDGDRWRAADEIEPGIFRFSPSASIVGHAIVCDREVQPRLALEYTTLSDQRALTRPCAAGTTDGVVRVSPAHADLSVGADLYLADGDAAAERTIAGTAAVVDLVAQSSGYVAIRRDVGLPLAGPLTIDVVADGVALQPVLLAPRGAADDESVTMSYQLITANGTVAEFAAGGRGSAAVAVPWVPASARIAGDRESLSVLALSESSFRRAIITAGSLVPSAPALPAPMPGVTVQWHGDRLDVAWQDRPDTAMRVRLDQEGRLFDVSLSPEWLTETGDGLDGSWQAPDLRAIDGWPADWALEPRLTATLWLVTAVDEIATASDGSLRTETGKLGWTTTPAR